MPGRSLVRAVLSPFMRAWRASAGLAEDISRANHAGRAWQEDSEIPNPYAGAGPTSRESERAVAEAETAEGARPPHRSRS